MSSLNPFLWREYPRDSIFASDMYFTGCKKTGKTQSQTTSEAVQAYTQRTGRSPGSIMGISQHSDRLVEESNRKRRAR